MAKLDTVTENEWFELPLRGFGQTCCDCGLAHDWDFKIVCNNSGHKLFAKLQTNKRATSAARRPIKKTVVIIE